jgi:hypothetical protein
MTNSTWNSRCTWSAAPHIVRTATSLQAGFLSELPLPCLSMLRYGVRTKTVRAGSLP